MSRTLNLGSRGRSLGTRTFVLMALLAATGCTAPCFRVRAVDAETGSPLGGVAVHRTHRSWQPHIPLCFPIPIDFPDRESSGVTDIEGGFLVERSHGAQLKREGYGHAPVDAPGTARRAIHWMLRDRDEVVVKMRRRESRDPVIDPQEWERQRGRLNPELEKPWLAPAGRAEE